MHAQESIDEQKRRERVLARVALPEFFVWWQDLSREHIKSFKMRLRTATKEEQIQSFLKGNPLLLVQHLSRWHGRWAIPKVKLGKHVTDFLIASKSSIGFEWQAIELESPKAKMFTKAGNPTSSLTHAIRQIQDWRNWIERNRDTAVRSRDDGGLGLTDIQGEVPGLILLGRRSGHSDQTRSLRRRIAQETRIKIHSYDWLLGEAERWVAISSSMASRKKRYL
jgi:hypothetical protein